MANSGTGVQSLNENPAARFGLGSAQFGRRYGATNRNPPPSPAEIERIVELAVAAGITWIDTAPDYGEAETVLGRFLPSLPSLRVVTKVAPLGDIEHGKAVHVLRAGVESSLRRLRRDRIDVLLLHRASDLARPDSDAIAAALHDLRSERLVGRIGASIYDENELNLVQARLQPDVVQLPLNPLDRRFADAAVVRSLLAAGVAVHARSLFLQGLLVARESELPTFARRHQRLSDWREWLAARNLSPLAACLGFALGLAHVELALVGVATIGELEALLEALATVVPIREVTGLPPTTPELSDPRSWPA